jgi:hypothetical protein
MLVRFEDEADEEYREAGQWYDARVEGLGVEFFDEVDSTLRQILVFPNTGATVLRMPPALPVRGLAVQRFPYHVIHYWSAQAGAFTSGGS